MNYLKDTDLTPAQIKQVLNLAAEVKANPRAFSKVLKGKTVALIFEKASLRTKFTLQIGIHQLGGFSVIHEGRMVDREPIQDIARNLNRWTDLIAARVYSHATLEELAAYSKLPVINALSDLYHPCQILADMLTLKEHFGKLKGLSLAFVGDGDNVAASLMLTSASLGLNFSIATPKNYQLDAKLVREAKNLNKKNGGSILVTSDIKKAVLKANAIYTDTWVSMGLEHETDIRRRIFKEYQITEQTFQLAAEGAVFMHCLPRHPGEEVADEVFESKRSLVFEQAENRLHTIKALLIFLLSKQEI